MGFFSSIISAAVKTALSPVAVAKDVVNVVTDEPADATKNLLEDAGQDLGDAVDSIIDP